MNEPLYPSRVVDIGRAGVAISNMSFDPQGRCHQLTRGRFRRWWQSRRGWTHVVGTRFRPWGDEDPGNIESYSAWVLVAENDT